MKNEVSLDPMARYKNLYKAAYAGAEVIVAGLTTTDAAEQAAMYFGISMEQFRADGHMKNPTQEDVLGYCRRFGKTAEMLVEHPRYGSVVLTALCREDAIMLASIKLNAPMYDMFSVYTTVKMSGRIKFYNEE